MRVSIILGTRPQIIKSAPIIQAFIEEFNLPEPITNLEVGSGSHAYQTGEIMLRLEKYLLKDRFSLALIPGGTNSALAGARCYDMGMAEEVNRRLIDHCSKILFAPTLNCKRNLERESVWGETYLTGEQCTTYS